MKPFTSVFDRAAEIPYLVLRNFEAFSEDSFLEDHPDVDILTSDRKAFVKAMGLVQRGKLPNPAHYKLEYQGRTIKFDVRTLTDGYYDPKWAGALLKGRIARDNYFVPTAEDYFYSLLYHALIQKQTFSEEYQIRLTQMAEQLQIGKKLAFSEKTAYRILEEYLRKKGYQYSCPRSLGTIFHIEHVDPALVEKTPLLTIRRTCYQKLVGPITRRKK